MFVEPSRLTLCGYLDQWMEDYVAHSVRPRTARGYGTIVKRIQTGSLSSTRLTSLKPAHVQRYYTQLHDEGLAPQTVHHHHSLLREAIGQAVKWDMLPQNIINRVTPPKVPKPELRILDEGEVKQLLDYVAGTDYHLPIHLALHTAMRRSEICGLFWSDVDLDSSSLTVVRTMVSLQGDPYHLDEPKSRRSRRVIAFGPETGTLLAERKAEIQRPRAVERQGKRILNLDVYWDPSMARCAR